VARHECPGLLLGAHGVAPSKSSLARRVARVLDVKSVRGPAARGFAAGIFVGAVMVAAPLAALTFTPAQSSIRPKPAKGAVAAHEPGSAYYPGSSEVAADLPHIIASGVSASVATATAAIAPTIGGDGFEAVAPNGARAVSRNGTFVANGPDGSQVTIYPPDASGHSKVVAVGATGAAVTSYVDRRQERDDTIDTAIQLKAMGISPEYIAAMRAASPALRTADLDEIIGLKSVGVTPQYVEDLTNAGFGNLSADDIQQARAVGLTGDYMRRIRATGVHVSLDDLVELRVLNISPEELARVHASGSLSREQMHALAVRHPPRPPSPPTPPSDNDDE